MPDWHRLGNYDQIEDILFKLLEIIHVLHLAVKYKNSASLPARTNFRIETGLSFVFGKSFI